MAKAQAKAKAVAFKTVKKEKPVKPAPTREPSLSAESSSSSSTYHSPPRAAPPSPPRSRKQVLYDSWFPVR